MPYAARPGSREPHLVFSAEGSRVRGFTGCDNLTGAFEHDADRLRFKALAMTRMAQPVYMLKAQQDRHKDGRIAEEWVMRDALGMLAQMGKISIGP